MTEVYRECKPLPLIVVMGVSGCGKSTIAKQLATHVNFRFIEADDFHSPQAKKMMAAGRPLTNELRAPWIDTLCGELNKLYLQREPVVMACSALVRAHREQFRKLPFEIQFIFLDGEQSLINERLSKRANHFFNPTLLNSQFTALERPDNEAQVHRIDIAQSSQTVLEQAISILAR